MWWPIWRTTLRCIIWESDLIPLARLNLCMNWSSRPQRWMGLGRNSIISTKNLSHWGSISIRAYFLVREHLQETITSYIILCIQLADFVIQFQQYIVYIYIYCIYNILLSSPFNIELLMCLGHGLGIGGNGGHPRAFHEALQVREPRHRQSDTVLALDVTHTLW